ncbi:hypothetical protein FHS79_000543 [Polymorphobacter multimanifer]|uniref:Uncharacterized protein n=1 Tax=Polymorphobacter multimanifer TaxID=1070431 RepID=A0A841L0P0_9SPHN|nr:hypothetical protein [Polymorphobacter multimanifer]
MRAMRLVHGSHASHNMIIECNAVSHHRNMLLFGNSNVQPNALTGVATTSWNLGRLQQTS